MGFKSLARTRARRLIFGLERRHIFFIHLLINNTHILYQFAQCLEMAITTFNLLVDNNPIEALFGRLRDKLLCQGNVLLSGETKAIDNALYLVFRILDAL